MVSDAAKWQPHAWVSNVWREERCCGAERLKKGEITALHTNQKPPPLMERIVLASSDPGDVIWEPFGGLCTGAVASARHGRPSYSAEIACDFYDEAVKRLKEVRAPTYQVGARCDRSNASVACPSPGGRRES